MKKDRRSIVHGRRRIVRGLLVALTLAAVVGWSPVDVQAQGESGVVGAALGMRQLDGVKRVLMIAAHPDDEDSSLLAALARGMGAEAAYLSLSRGEGGQNLIGPRLHEGLGVIRTGELVAAREIDGAGQYFTRAVDFGFSKTADETLTLWPFEEVLRDVVFVVRKFRPQMIVSVFSGTPRDGHGQHQVAGMAAREAFAAAGDPQRFPELAARGVAPWQPAKLYRSARFSPTDATTSVPTGTFDPVLGRSTFQLAMESRSQHRSQDMGAAQTMGPRASLLRLVAWQVGGAAVGSGTLSPSGEAPPWEDGVFAGIDTTLVGQLGAPIPAGWPADTEPRLRAYREAVTEAEAAFSFGRPAAAVAGLSEAAAILRGLIGDASSADADGRRVLERRLEQVSETIVAAAGVVTDVRVGRDILTPGESVVVDVTVWNGGDVDLVAVRPELVLAPDWDASPTEEAAGVAGGSPFFRMPPPATPADGVVAAGSIARWSWKVDVPGNAPASTPWYLADAAPEGAGARENALYRWPQDEALWARPFAPAPIRARVAMTLDHDVAPVRLALERAGHHVGVDKATGEYRKSVLVVPAIGVTVDPRSMAWPIGTANARTINVVLTNTSQTRRSGSLRLEAPAGWQVDPATARFALDADGANAAYAFAVSPSTEVAQGSHVFHAVARTDDLGAAESDAEYGTEYDVIDHAHIPRAVMAREAALHVSAFAVSADTDLRVGYVMGSGDEGAAALRQIGMQVNELAPAQVRAGDFAGYDVVVLGIRAYETRPDLVAANEALLDFARGGGTVIAQYNKYEFSAGGFAPYPLAIRRPHDRVTDEAAPVAVLSPQSPVWNQPNAVGAADFEGWVQERGLYFAGDWDDRYTPMVEMADPGEDPKRGGLLVARVGDGLYVYTGLAFFRQFPASVPGAYRLFANLVSLRAEDWPAAGVSPEG